MHANWRNIDWKSGIFLPVALSSSLLRLQSVCRTAHHHSGSMALKKRDRNLQKIRGLELFIYLLENSSLVEQSKLQNFIHSYYLWVIFDHYKLKVWRYQAPGQKDQHRFLEVWCFPKTLKQEKHTCVSITFYLEYYGALDMTKKINQLFSQISILCT